eukprot:3365056-Rhodomonas_salina.1
MRTKRESEAAPGVGRGGSGASAWARNVKEERGEERGLVEPAREESLEAHAALYVSNEGSCAKLDVNNEGWCAKLD